MKAHTPAFLLSLLAAGGLSAQSPLKIETPDASIKFGFLIQPAFEAVESPVAEGTTQNVFIRRARFLVGGTLFKDFEFFFDTDYPDLGKSDATGRKNTPGLNIQDAFLTYKIYGDALKVDAGYMLPPMAHNAVQGATSLYGWDYYANSFRHGNAFNTSSNPIGRDTGLQFRGLVANNHLEYRVGAFQGQRDAPVAATPTDPARVQSRNALRTTARLQFNVFDAETGYFYAGTYLGAKKILSFGVSYDRQNDYKYLGFDGFFDYPVGQDVITLQVNHASWDGGTWLALPEQKSLMAEGGYRFGAVKLSPIVRYEKRTMDTPTAVNFDEKRESLGLAWWYGGHNSNLKLFYTKVKPENLTLTSMKDYNQINLQWQLFMF